MHLSDSSGTLSSSGNNGSSLDTVSTPSSLSQHSEQWSLDTLGNWASLATDGGSAITRTHNSKNEVTAISGLTSPTFDYNGNTTTDQAGNTYIYDAWNRLISVTSSGSTLLATYVYDAQGWRARETHSSTTTDVYFDHQWQNIEERQSSTVTNQYVWTHAYIDGMVLRDDNSTSGNLGISGSGLGRRLYVQQDGNWNTTALVNPSGTVQERFVYDPYGNTQVLTSGGSATRDSYNWVYRHQGGRLDSNTGNYIFRHRDYSPTLGRWMETDAVGYLDSLNLYLALRSNPVIGADPFGFVDKNGLPDPEDWDNWLDYPEIASKLEYQAQQAEQEVEDNTEWYEWVAKYISAPLAAAYAGWYTGEALDSLFGISDGAGDMLGKVQSGCPLNSAYTPNPGPYQPTPTPPPPYIPVGFCPGCVDIGGGND